jgi:hopanoid C-2 methylase
MTRKRALIVNAYCDELRRPVARPNKIPRAMTPAFLAGVFDRDACEVRLHDELHDGPLSDPALLGWPDLLVLTGLNTAFDRIKQLTAYARTLNPRVVVTAGGSAIRALPRLAARYVDYVCTGDIEQLADVIRDAWGPGYAAEDQTPRFDLLKSGRIGYAETSRNCQFRCSFCTLSAHRRRYESYTPIAIRRQIEAQGYKDIVVLLDNNFYGPDRNDFHARLNMLDALHREGCMGGWAALVSGDFFTPENLHAARQAGCLALFSGVESFDSAWLRTRAKFQNTRLPQEELIARCHEAGIVFLYGMMLDLTSRRIADIRTELDFVFGNPRLSLPSYLAMPIPLLGTPFFRDCVREGRMLPNVRLRDMDATTLTLRPLDPLPEAVAFVRDLQQIRGYRLQALLHTARFAHRNFSRFNAIQKLISLGNVAALCAPTLASGTWSLRTARTFVATTEPLDGNYRPALPVAPKYADHFRPTMVTDAQGQLTEEIAECSGSYANARHDPLAGQPTTIPQYVRTTPSSSTARASATRVPTLIG